MDLLLGYTAKSRIGSERMAKHSYAHCACSCVKKWYKDKPQTPNSPPHTEANKKRARETRDQGKVIAFLCAETNHKCNSDKGSQDGRKARILVNGEETRLYSQMKDLHIKVPNYLGTSI